MHKSLSSFVLYSPINDRLDGDHVLSGFRLDRIVKPFSLVMSLPAPLVVVLPYGLYQETECLFHSRFGATDDFLDYNLLPSLPLRLLFTGLAVPFLIHDLARSRVQE